MEKDLNTLYPPPRINPNATKPLALRAYQPVKPQSSVASNLNVRPKRVWHREGHDYGDMVTEPSKPAKTMVA